MSTKRAEPRLFEFRVKYNAGSYHSAMDSHHYYYAKDEIEALNNHNFVIKKTGSSQTLKVEKFNPYSGRWEDKSEVLAKDANFNFQN